MDRYRKVTKRFVKSINPGAGVLFKTATFCISHTLLDCDWKCHQEKSWKSSASKSSKVSSADHPSQPSKFGIQQLFLRHFKNSQSTSSFPSSSIASGNEVLAPQNPPDMLDRQADNVEESSHEVSKTFKHFKFSPGTVIASAIPLSISFRIYLIGYRSFSPLLVLEF
ncbi:PREDICTED: uncharacterized protein LOC104808237 [Tarenaya hassleriana]|uniref:uncharacterized protein LOC104808237 n=1 Tax=Tarenaya hassleriana TaxID=28532 RepID=UPI00053C6621|nr:PREDICTED: uncharacterized protein LOC104808237 [Tarenaya hassleriana]